MINLERFQHISVLGAAGKMGSGILLLNVLHSAKMKHLPDFVGKTFVINAIDQSYDQLDHLNEYLKVQVQKWAESNIVWLRKAFNNRPHLIDNKDVIETFVFEALALVKHAISKEAAYHSTLVFEAITEDEAIKTEVLADINVNNPHDPWFLTNTSSIPIHVLNERAKLDGNIVGCHFYNPPAVQKLIEVIELKNGNPDLVHLVNGFGKQMKKVMVPSNDVAGFIGNGFFIRDILFAGELVNRLMPELYLTDAITAVDIITRDLLVRPMGIFQLIDYVGIDVCQFIMDVMSYHLDKEMVSPLLNDWLLKGVKGGQNADGSQKDGIFKYVNGRAVSIFDTTLGTYIDIIPIHEKVYEYLDVHAKGYTWKQLSRSKYTDQHLEEFFTQLLAESSPGALLTQEYMEAMKQIALQLVEDGVAHSTDDVNTVMQYGFYHLYGPVNDYL